MLDAADLWLLRTVYAGGSGHAWRDVIAVVTFLGSGWMLLGLVPILLLRRTRAQSAALLVTTAVTSAVVASVKVLAGRVRPCHALDWARAIAVAPPTDPSFPSGHAAGSFAFAVFIFASNRRVGGVLLGAATAVALSRVALGVHYPSDVVAGAFLGASLGWIGARIKERYAASTTVGLTDADSESVGQ